QVSVDGGATYQEAFNTSGAVAVGDPGGAASIALPIPCLEGASYIKVRSGTSGTPVNQGAERALKVVSI
ncbi:MAG: hypothetical protein JSV90_05035, partial [Methanobacteriota archaeon]